jgi:hypothetical protein
MSVAGCLDTLQDSEHEGSVRPKAPVKPVPSDVTQSHPVTVSSVGRLPSITFPEEEIDTGHPAEGLTDWRRLLSIYDKLSPSDRENLIRLSSAWEALDDTGRILLTELGRRLRLAQKEQ